MHLDVIHVSPARDPQLAEFMTRAGFPGECEDSVALVPLRAKGEVIGLLLARAENRDESGDDWLRTVKLLAGQISGPLALSQVSHPAPGVTQCAASSPAADLSQAGATDSESPETDTTREQVPS